MPCKCCGTELTQGTRYCNKCGYTNPHPLQKPVLWTLIAAAVAVWGVCSSDLWQREKPTFTKILASQPIYESKLMDAQLRGKRGTVREEAKVQVALQGMSRLDDVDIELLGTIRLEMLETASVGICAIYGRGDRPSDFITSYDRLPQKRLEEYARIVAKGAEAHLKNQGTPRKVEEGALREAMGAVLDQLSEHDRTRLIKTFQDLSKANDEDACWSIRTVHRIALKLERPHRSIIMRSFLL